MLGEKETNKYLGILEADTIKLAEMKEKIKREWTNEWTREKENSWRCIRPYILETI